VLSAIKRSQDATFPYPSSMFSSFYSLCYVGRVTPQRSQPYGETREIQREMEAIPLKGRRLADK